MTAAGWTLMITVIGSFTAVLLYCSWKVASMPRTEAKGICHSALAHPELDTPDMHTEE